MDRFARFLVRHRYGCAAVALLGLGVALSLASRLTLRDRATDFFPKASPSDSAVLGANRSGADRIIVILESPNPMTADTVGPVLDSVAARLAAIDGVRRVEYRVRPELRRFFTDYAPKHLVLYYSPESLDTLRERLGRPYMERALLGVDGGVRRSPLAIAMGAERADPLDVVGPAIARLRELSGGARLKIVDGYFASPDQRIYFLTVEPTKSLDGIDATGAMVAAVNRILESTVGPPLMGKRLFAVGRPVGYVEVHAAAMKDAARVGIASTVVVLLLLIVGLRRVVAPLFIVGTVLYGLSLTAGLADLLFGSVSLVGWLFIVTLIGFGDEFGLYVVTHYWTASPPGASRAEALASALRRPGTGLLLGGLTSAAAFFSLVVMSYPVMVQLAWLSTLGLLIILACSFTILPLALSFTAPGHSDESRWYRWPARLKPSTGGRRRAWLVVWGLLVVGSLVAMRGLRLELQPWKAALREIKVTAELERARQMLGASFIPFLMVSRGRTPEEALAADRAAVRALDRIRDRAGVSAVVSLSPWLPPEEQQRASIDYVERHREAFSAERFSRDFSAVVARMPERPPMLETKYRPLVARYLSRTPAILTLDSLRQLGLGDFVAEHLVHHEAEYRAISEVYPTRFPWAAGVVDRFTRAVREDGDPALAGVTFVGDAFRGTRPAVLRRDMLLASGLTLGLVLLVLVARFRRLGPIILCLLPLAVGVAVSLGLMALLGIELNVLTLAVAPLIIGLGSDDGIHIVDRLECGEPIDQVLAETGAPMILTTVTTIAGFACFGFATFAGVRQLGLLAAVGLVVCLLASLHLVPLCHSGVRAGTATT
jgi:predicted RND superfamily exporter protein